jgi:DNA-binding protein HU-beta
MPSRRDVRPVAAHTCAGSVPIDLRHVKSGPDQSHFFVREASHAAFRCGNLPAFCEGGKALNKGELIEALAEANEMSVSQSRRYLESMLDMIEKKIKKGEEVNITGFGKFEVVKRAGRKGRNPATGESIKVPARKVPKFVPGASLKRSVSGK